MKKTIKFGSLYIFLNDDIIDVMFDRENGFRITPSMIEDFLKNYHKIEKIIKKENKLTKLKIYLKTVLCSVFLGRRNIPMGDVRK